MRWGKYRVTHNKVSISKTISKITTLHRVFKRLVLLHFFSYYVWISKNLNHCFENSTYSEIYSYLDRIRFPNFYYMYIRYVRLDYTHISQDLVCPIWKISHVHMRIPLSQCSKNEKRMQQKCVAQSNKNIYDTIKFSIDFGNFLCWFWLRRQIVQPPKNCPFSSNFRVLYFYAEDTT